MLRRSIPADSAVFAAIHASAFAPPDAWSAAVFHCQLLLPNVIGLLHPDGGIILLRTAADEAEILTLAVTPQHRRQGIATALLLAATDLVRAQGVTAMFLEVSASNVAAQLLYARAGFVATGRRPHYYSDRSDALVMCLSLASDA